MHERRSSGGFTLVETLVAMLIVAVGLLGVTSLQLASLQAGVRALELLAATGLVGSHAERVRALHDAPTEARELLGGPGAPFGCGPTRACTAVEFAADEAARWSAIDGVAWETVAPRIDLGAAPTLVVLGIERVGEPLVALEVET